MAIIEFKANSAFQISKFDYQGKTYIGIARMFKKHDSKDWQMGKNVSIPYNTKEDKSLLHQVIVELQKYE